MISGRVRLATGGAGPVDPAHLLVPAPVMPMTSQIGSFVGNHHQVVCARRDGSHAPGTQILFGSLVRLDRGDGHVEKTAHAIKASIAAIATITMMMSNAVFLCSRKGLKPTNKR